MRLCDILEPLDRLAPLRQAETWDNVGLLAGDKEQPVSRILLTIDYTAEVHGEAKASGAQLVVAYHPPIFEGLKRIEPGPVADALREGIALYSPHTALDVAEGGTNDVLADLVGMEQGAAQRRPLRWSKAKERDLKLVTFVPEASVDAVADALFQAGAGVIGEYESCSFRTQGTGTFFGRKGTSPVVGHAGQLECAPEVRLEMILPASRAPEIVRVLVDTHPYEEPAFDLVRLAEPVQGGLGRIGPIAPIGFAKLLENVKRSLGVANVLVAGPRDREVKRVAVAAGSCGDMYMDASRQGADVFLTGEMRHHDALKAAELGLTVICVLHSNSERAALVRFGERLKAMCADVDVMVSKEDRDPFVVV